MTSTVESIDPRTGRTVESVGTETSSADLEAIVGRAEAAAPAFEAAGRRLRARLLRAVADQLESRRSAVIQVGARETALTEARLGGELTRTVYQARLFADVVEEGGYLEATIDHAGDTPMGSGPDLRRMLVPIGPVAVFGASNFPLAFSVPGGDTVSALAAGCPVVVKAHPSPPATSLLTFEALTAAAQEVGAPDGVLGMVFGQQAGADLVAHPAIRAVSFTGSQSGGRALLEIINARSQPIPFYGELSSLNPVVITAGATAARPQQLAEGLVASVTGSGGQLCTKPGLIFVPSGAEGDVLVEHAAQLVNEAPAATLLNQRISEAYDEISSDLEGLSSLTVVARGCRADGDGFDVAPKLLQVKASDLQDEELEECFGPVAVIARYEAEDLSRALDGLPASLTGTIHAETDETATIQSLTSTFKGKSGRVLYDGWPTGVLVSWAQQHGGPWPSTNTLHTSVGTSAVRRFLRPVTWQNAPAAVLPEELQDSFESIPRRVDGTLVTPRQGG